MPELSGADILVEALCDLGVEVVFGYPGGAVLPIYDAMFRSKPDQAHPRPPRTGGDPRRGGLCPLDRQARRRARHLRPRRDQRGHRHHRRADGLDPDGRHHRPGADRADRHRRLPGGGHGRHHPPLLQAQLSGEGPGQARRRHPRGVPHRHLAAAPARSSSTSPRTSRSRPRATASPARSSTRPIARRSRPTRR